tara:strand:- start:3024 stop:3791 length:768 start_codon:yes stop_codon:yes gene_type:complete
LKSKTCLNVLVISGGLLFALPGCENGQSISDGFKDTMGSVKSGFNKVFNDGKTDSSAVAGVGAGAATYSVLKAAGNEDAEKWALAVGAGTYIADKVITQEVEKRRERYRKESDYLDAEIDAAETEINAKENELAELDKDLVEKNHKITQMEQQATRDVKFTQSAKALKAELEEQIKENKTKLEMSEAEIEIYTEAIRTSPEQSDNAAAEQECQVRRDELHRKRDQRLAQYRRLLGIQKSYEQQHSRVSALTPEQG